MHGMLHAQFSSAATNPQMKGETCSDVGKQVASNAMTTSAHYYVQQRVTHHRLLPIVGVIKCHCDWHHRFTVNE
jgi:hypothetical protein